MKKIIMIASACFVILMGTSSFAGCGGGNSCGNSYNSCGSNSGCGSSDTCSPYVNPCECTDPSCGWTWENNCMSQSECCEAFGNMGAR